MEKWIVGNWKMFGSSQQVDEFIGNAPNKLKNISSHIRLALAPAHVFLAPLIAGLKGTGILVGAQNCSEHEGPGSFTGQVSALMIRDIQADFVILGHSECRQAGERDEHIALKVNAALKAGLSVILCVGETKEQLEAGERAQVIQQQIQIGLTSAFPLAEPQQILIAYEPVWAIGTGMVPELPDLKETMDFCRTLIQKRGLTKTPVLYGGSVTPLNVTQIIANTGADGVLVGKASTNPTDYFQLALNCP